MSRVNTKQDKCQKNKKTTVSHIIFKLWCISDKEKILKEALWPGGGGDWMAGRAGGGRILPVEEQR